MRTLKFLWRRSSARYALLTLMTLATLALLAPVLSPYTADQLDWNNIAQAPNFANAHWFGTDRLGRDLFVRTFQGIGVSLVIVLIATSIASILGLVWGSVAGHRGGQLGEFMMRIVDILDSIPSIFIVIIVMALVGHSSIYALSITLGLFGWFALARIVRGATLSVKAKEFVKAAIVNGASTSHVLIRHILPNIAGPVVVYCALMLVQMTLVEGFLSFLGLGIQEPLSSLGALLNDGVREMEAAVWLLWIPVGAFALLVGSFNCISDALRDEFELNPTSPRML